MAKKVSVSMLSDLNESMKDTNPTSTEPSHHPDTDEGAAKVDRSQDDLRNERILDTDRLENSRAVAMFHESRAQSLAMHVVTRQDAH